MDCKLKSLEEIEAKLDGGFLTDADPEEVRSVLVDLNLTGDYEPVLLEESDRRDNRGYQEARV